VTPFVFVLVALAAYRSWKLVGDDDIAAGFRARLPAGPGTFVGCPWCAGSWVAAGWWAAWEQWPDGTATAAIPFALATLVGVLATVQNRLADLGE
jgi:hypothetical protein